MLTRSHCPPLGSHSGNGSGVEYSVLLIMAPDGGADGSTAPDADVAGDASADEDADVDGDAAGVLAAADDGADDLAAGVVAPAACGELLLFRSKPR